MSKIYKYKRVGLRKQARIFSIFSSAIIILMLSTSNNPVDLFPIVLLIITLCVFLLYTAYKKSLTSIKDGIFEIVGAKIPFSKIKKIELSEKRIDIDVEKGIFPLTTHLWIIDECFYSSDDWNDFKRDIENLKTLIIQ